MAKVGLYNTSSVPECSKRFLGLKVLKDSLSVYQLLGKEAGGGKHGKTSVLEFLGLESEKLFGIIGLQAKRIESKVSRDVRVTKKSRLGNGDVLGLNPADGGTLLLGSSNGNGQKGPENWGNLGQVGDGRSRDLGIEKERRSLDLLTNKETNNLVDLKRQVKKCQKLKNQNLTQITHMPIEKG